MAYSLEIKMAHDDIHAQILGVARTTLSDLPDADRLLADLKEQLALAHATQTQLRADMRALVAEYRAWRRAARCGRTTGNLILLHPTYMKQTRRVWATYRLTQLLLRDMEAMASLRARANEATQRIPAYQLSGQLPQPANEQTANYADDGISYDELETKYGPVLAQRLYDEIMAQLREDRMRAARIH